MLDFGICAVTNFFRIYLIYRFASVFLGEVRKERGCRIGVCSLFYIVNVILFWEFHLVWINIICNLAGISAIVWLYTKSAKTNIFVTSTIYLLNIGCDVVSTAPFIHYHDGELHSQLYAAMSVFFFFICELLVEKLVITYKNAETEHNLPLILVPLCSVIVICFLAYTNTCTGVDIAVVGLGMLLINFLMLYLYDQLGDLITRKYEIEMMEQKVQAYAHQLVMITQSEEKVKAIRHDMKHHLNEIKLLAGKYEAMDIQEYIDRMNMFLGGTGELVDSGNIEIDSVLNYMLQKARQELGEVKAKVKLPENLLHSFEVNVIIGNLLENAIEAAGKTPEKFLNVSIIFEKAVLRILVENSFWLSGKEHKGAESRRANQANTEKIKKHHGIGLKNVRKIVESYHGVMEITAEGNIFRVEIMLYIEEQAVS